MDATKPTLHVGIRDASMLRQVSYLGTARSGLTEWRTQRLTALALIPLGLYFVGSVLHLVINPHAAAQAWLSRPYNALLMILLIVAMFSHALMGLRSILADYVHKRLSLLLTRTLVQGLTVVLSLAGLLAVLKVYLGIRGAA